MSGAVVEPEGDRERRREAVAAMLLICPRANVEASVIELYLRVCRHVPTWALTQAIDELLRGWTLERSHGHAPMPGEVMKRASEIMGRARTARWQAQIEADLRPPGPDEDRVAIRDVLEEARAKPEGHFLRRSLPMLERLAAGASVVELEEGERRGSR